MVNECQTCGDTESVPKSVAWDAFWTIPPETQTQLDLLKQLNEQVKDITNSIYRDRPDSNWVGTSITFDGEKVLKILKTCDELEKINE